MSQSFKLLVNILIQYMSSMLNDNFSKQNFWEIPFMGNFALPSLRIIYSRGMVDEFVMYLK